MRRLMSVLLWLDVDTNITIRCMPQKLRLLGAQASYVSSCTQFRARRVSPCMAPCASHDANQCCVALATLRVAFIRCTHACDIIIKLRFITNSIDQYLEM